MRANKTFGFVLASVVASTIGLTGVAPNMARADGQAEEIVLLKNLTEGLIHASPENENVWRRTVANTVCKPQLATWKSDYAASQEKRNYDAWEKGQLASKLAAPGAAAALKEQRKLLGDFIEAWKSQLTTDDLAHMQRASDLIAQHKPYTTDEAQYADFIEQRMTKFAQNYFDRHRRYYTTCRDGDAMDSSSDACTHDPGFFSANQYYQPLHESLGGSNTAWDEDDAPGMIDTRHKTIGVYLTSEHTVNGPGSDIYGNSVRLALYPAIDVTSLSSDYYMLQNYAVPYRDQTFGGPGFAEYENGESPDGYLAHRYGKCFDTALKTTDLQTLLSAVEDKPGSAGPKSVGPGAPAAQPSAPVAPHATVTGIN